MPTIYQLSVSQIRSDQISCSVVSDSLRPHESQHARPPCPSPTPGVHSDSRLSSQWCHPAITSSVIPFSSCPQSLPASKSFPMSQLFAWDGQSTGVSALTSFLSKKSQGWSPLKWTGWISLQSKRLSSLLQHHSSKASISSALSFLHSPTLTSIHDHWKNHCFRRTFVGKVLSLLFNMLSRLVITFLPRSKCLLISWLQSPSAVTLEPKKIKPDTVSTVSPSISHEVTGPDAMSLVFWVLSFKPTFSHSSFTFSKRIFSSSLSATRVVSSAYLRLLIFLQAFLIPACA